MTHERIYHRHAAQRPRSNLALHAARQDEVRAARRPIGVSSTIVSEAYREIKEREAFALMQIETRDGLIRPLCSEPLTDSEMTQLETDDDFQDACDEARERIEDSCKGDFRNGPIH